MIRAAVVALASLLVAGSASGSAPLAVKSGATWYWSAGTANAAFPPFTRLDDGTIIYKASCRGIGSSIASDVVNVDLYHHFRCTLYGATHKRKAQFDRAVDLARAKSVAAKGTPEHDVLYAALGEAEAKRAQYDAHGDSFVTPVTIVVTARRKFAVL